MALARTKTMDYRVAPSVHRLGAGGHAECCGASSSTTVGVTDEDLFRARCPDSRRSPCRLQPTRRRLARQRAGNFRRHGQYPANWADLVRAGLIPALPLDPARVAFVYDATTHHVKLGPGSPLAPLPQGFQR